MCGRYSLSDFSEAFAKRFQVSNIQGVNSPRYNVSPTQMMPVVVRDRDGSNRAELMQWGLIPYWSHEPKGFINARAETAPHKPSFKRAFRQGRCLVPASSFFEWKKTVDG